jgi:hypothetical protein
VLAKGEVGASKPFTHTLPGDSHVYGAKVTRDQYNAKHLTSQWDEGKLSKATIQETDFCKLNKLGLKKGISGGEMKGFINKNRDVRQQPKRYQFSE